MKRLLTTFLALFIVSGAFAQLNGYFKLVQADSMRARVDTLNIINTNESLIAVNDTSLIDYIQFYGGGGSTPNLQAVMDVGSSGIGLSTDIFLATSAEGGISTGGGLTAINMNTTGDIGFVGQIFSGIATGGAQTAGSINVTDVFVNGTALDLQYIGNNGATMFVNSDIQLGSNTSGVSITGDQDLYFESFSGNFQAFPAGLFEVGSGSGATFGSPTGGGQGAGTINVSSGFFVNGVAFTSPSFGSNNQIPYMNLAGDDYDYGELLYESGTGDGLIIDGTPGQNNVWFYNSGVRLAGVRSTTAGDGGVLFVDENNAVIGGFIGGIGAGDGQLSIDGDMDVANSGTGGLAVGGATGGNVNQSVNVAGGYYVNNEIIVQSGTFTPVFEDESGNPATGTISGRYQRVFDQILVNITANTISTAGMTAGDTLKVDISGVGFTPNNMYQGSFHAENVNFAAGVTYAICETLSNQDFIYFVDVDDSAAATVVTVGDLTSGTAEIDLTLSYLQD